MSFFCPFFSFFVVFSGVSLHFAVGFDPSYSRRWCLAPPSWGWWLAFPSFLELGLARPSCGWCRLFLLQVGISPSFFLWGFALPFRGERVAPFVLRSGCGGGGGVVVVGVRPYTLKNTKNERVLLGRILVGKKDLLEELELALPRLMGFRSFRATSLW